MYLIKKTMVKDGKKTHVLLNNEYSEILEIKHENIARKLCSVMNENSDSGHFYDVVESNSN
tara:strand:- start:1081 stop:1263 length:183 start_codon:yes stop_codon:yes gene_type:complete